MKFNFAGSPLAVLLTTVSLLASQAQAIEFDKGIRARTFFEDSSLPPEEAEKNTLLGVTPYLNAYSRTRKIDLSFRGELDFQSSDESGTEVVPTIFLGNVLYLDRNHFKIDSELNLYKRNVLDSAITSEEFNNFQDGQETLSYRVTPIYEFNVSRSTRIKTLYSFQRSEELDTEIANHSTSHLVEVTWTKPAATNQFAWSASTGYSTTDFSSNERLDQTDASLAIGFSPRRRLLIGALVGQNWEEISTDVGGVQSDMRWSLFTVWQPTARFSTVASYGRTDTIGNTFKLKLGVEGARWEFNLRLSRSSSYPDFTFDASSLLPVQPPLATEADDGLAQTPLAPDQQAQNLFEQTSVDEEATIAYGISGRRSKIISELAYFSRSEPDSDDNTNILAIRAGFFRKIKANWAIGILHETAEVRPEAAADDNYMVYETELSVDVKF